MASPSTNSPPCMALLSISDSRQYDCGRGTTITADQYASMQAERPTADTPGVDGPKMRRELLKRGQHSDFTLICDGEASPVHEKFLVAASPYFRALVEGGFHESVEGQATHEETSPIAPAFLLFMIYDGSNSADMRQLKSFWRKKLTKLDKKAAQEEANSSPDVSEEQSPDLSPLQSTSWIEFQTLLDCYELSDRLMLSEALKTGILNEMLKIFTSALLRTDKNSTPAYLNLSHCAHLLEVVCQFCDATGLGFVGDFVAECCRHKETIIRNGLQHNAALSKTLHYQGREWCIWSILAWLAIEPQLFT